MRVHRLDDRPAPRTGSHPRRLGRHRLALARAGAGGRDRRARRQPGALPRRCGASATSATSRSTRRNSSRRPTRSPRWPRRSCAAPASRSCSAATTTSAIRSSPATTRRSRTAGVRRIGYIQIDAHFDLQDNNPTHGTHWHGSNARRVAELEGFNPVNMVWMGVYDIAWRDEWDFVQRTGATAMTDRRGARGRHRAGRQAGRWRSPATAATRSTCRSISTPSTTRRAGNRVHQPGRLHLARVPARRCARSARRTRSAASTSSRSRPRNDHKGITAYLAALGLVEFLSPRILDRGQ